MQRDAAFRKQLSQSSSRCRIRSRQTHRQLELI